MPKGFRAPTPTRTKQRSKEQAKTGTPFPRYPSATGGRSSKAVRRGRNLTPGTPRGASARGMAKRKKK